MQICSYHCGNAVNFSGCHAAAHVSAVFGMLTGLWTGCEVKLSELMKQHRSEQMLDVDTDIAGEI